MENQNGLDQDFQYFSKEFVRIYENELTTITAIREEKKINFESSILFKRSKHIDYFKKCSEAILSIAQMKPLGKMTSSGIEFGYTKIFKDYINKIVHGAENLIEFWEKDKANFRKKLVEGCFEIFEIYENQLLMIDSNLGHKAALRKLAQYSVSRSINYLLEKNEFPIAESIILGSCDVKIIFKFNYKESNSQKSVKLENFFKKPGIIISNNGSIKYYTKNELNVEKYGFRHPFIWEKLNEIEENYEVIRPPKEFESHKYVLKYSNPQKYVNYVLNILNIGKNLSERKEEPIWYNIKISLSMYSRNITDKTTEILKTMNDHKPVVIVGLGGIGKTTSAVRCAEEYRKKENSNVIWINADDIRNSVHSLCNRKLKIKLEAEGEKRPLNYIFDDIYEYFKNKRCLIIFDNAENYSSIEEFLPFKRSESSLDILITSTNSKYEDWPRAIDFYIVTLDNFKESESLKFLKHKLNIKDDSQDDDLKNFANRLKNYPLALNHAADDYDVMKNAYQNRNSDLTISNYITLLNSSEDLDYKEIMIKCLNSKLDKFQNENYGEMALKMFKALSYFKPKFIPDDLFDDWLAEGKRNRQIKITKTLEKFSMVKLNDRMLHMHDLIQEIGRLTFESEEENILRIVLSIFNSKIKSIENESIEDNNKPENNFFLSFDQKMADYVPHLISAWKYAYRHDILIEEFIVNDPNISDNRASFFHLIVGHANFKILKTILEKIPSELRQTIINAKTRHSKKSPTHYAVESGCENKIKLLMENKCNPNLKNNIKHTPLHLAIKNNYKNIVNILLHCEDLIIDTPTTMGFTALHYAAKMGDEITIKKLIEKSANINAKTKYGFTPLHLSSQFGCLDATIVLLENEINLNAVTNYNETPLTLAVRKGHRAIVKLLLNKGADPNVPTNKNKFTSLHEAIVNNHLGILEILLSDPRVDVFIKAKDDKTALDFAKETNCPDMIEAVSSRINWQSNPIGEL